MYLLYVTWFTVLDPKLSEELMQSLHMPLVQQMLLANNGKCVCVCVHAGAHGVCCVMCALTCVCGIHKFM